MRQMLVALLSTSIMLGCQAEPSQPDLKKPLSALPEGACMILVSSDLANTWERVEAYEALNTIRRLFPEEGVLDNSNFTNFKDRLEEFESDSGTNIQDDIVLNLLGQRTVVGVYAGSLTGSDLLLVAEVESPRRLGRAFKSLRESEGSDLQFEDVEIKGVKAIHLYDGSGIDFIFALKDKIFFASTTRSLIARAFATHDGNGAAATDGPRFMEAMDELGLQNVSIVGLGGNIDRVSWGAQGLTWDDTGVHFTRMVRDTKPAKRSMPEDTPDRRAEILGSVPSGMILTFYGKPEDRELFSTLFGDLSAYGDCLGSGMSPDARGLRQTRTKENAKLLLASFESIPERFELASPWVQRVVSPSSMTLPLGINQLPFNLEQDILPWSGDEWAVVVGGMVKTEIAPLPSLAFIIETIDPDTAERTLNDLESTFSGLPIDIADGFTDVRYGGQTFRSFSQPLIEAISPSYLVDGNIVVIASTRLLMQRIIDTRRIGKRHLLDVGSFAAFNDFVPDSASAALYVDQRLLARAYRQLSGYVRMFSKEWGEAMKAVDELEPLFDHFPASAMYLEYREGVLVLSGWMQEVE